jgi:A/G-specific adenine glycosylase
VPTLPHANRHSRRRITAAPDAAAFAPRVLAWFARHGRHDLPWQHPRSAYRVWVSEVMLQQTQVATAIPYFERFIERFPDTRALADAPLDEVLHLWSGLGYYARARNLHRAARWLGDHRGGELPNTLEALQELPGIGRSTAGAILALAFDQRQPILDGNVKRVLARWFGVDGYPSDAPVTARLWALSDAVTPASCAADFVQAIMDLGATLCTRTRPACAACPVGDDCVARATGRADQLPAAKPRHARPTRAVFWLVVRRGPSVLLEQRPPRGVWGGLWGFPEFASRARAERALRGVSAAGRAMVAPVIEHSFTHFNLRITPLLAELPRAGSELVEGPARAWYNSDSPARLGFAAPVAELLRSLDGAPDRKPHQRSG